MSLTLTFTIPVVRSVRTRAVSDPAQYDVEINAARGFKSHTLTNSKSKKIKPITKTKVDPAQFDVEENLERHLPTW